jgi:hypothetical protein
MEVLLSILIIGTFVLNLALLGYMVYLGLRMKADLVDNTMARVRPMVAKGKAIIDTGRREAEENKDRFGSFLAEVKALAATVRPRGEAAGPKTTFGYRHLLIALSVLRSLRHGLADVNRTLKPTSNPPGPPVAKKKAPPRRLGTLELLPSIIRLVREVRQALR